VETASSEADRSLERLLIEAKSKAGSASRAALSEILSRLYPRLLTYLYGVTPDRATAEDVCQETMVRIVAGLPRFAPRAGSDATAAFQAWAFTIANNVYRDFLRKYGRVTPVAEVTEAGGGLRGSGQAEDEAIMDLEVRSLLQAVETLPMDQRNVFLLKAYYGYSHGEIARIVGCPEGTAKSRLHYAVLALRDELKRRGTL
jgi:RNA polymerase sigma-70 factor (ECF subfamily)